MTGDQPLPDGHGSATGICKRLLVIAFLLSAAPAVAQKTHEICAPCHGEHVTDLESHKHFSAGLSCDACHGKSEKHRLANGAAPPDRVAAPDEAPALCGACHKAQHQEYLQSKHAKLVMARSGTKSASCGTCHGVHAPRQPAGMKQQCQRCHAALPDSCKASPAKAAAKVSCMNCHAKHTLVSNR